MLRGQGRFDEARPWVEEAVVIARELGDRVRLALTLRSLGWAALDQRDYRVARSVVEESLALYRTMGNEGEIGRSLNFLASLARVQGDYETARARWEESAMTSRRAGDHWAFSIALANLGKLAACRDDQEAARSHFEHSLILRRENRDVRGIAECLEGIAALACEAGERERAARLFGAAEAVNEVAGAQLFAHWPVERGPAVALLRDSLGPAVFAAAWEQGQAMPMEQAIAEALREGGRCSPQLPASEAAKVVTTS